MPSAEAFFKPPVKICSACRIRSSHRGYTPVEIEGLTLHADQHGREARKGIPQERIHIRFDGVDIEPVGRNPALSPRRGPFPLPRRNRIDQDRQIVPGQFIGHLESWCSSWSSASLPSPFKPFRQKGREMVSYSVVHPVRISISADEDLHPLMTVRRTSPSLAYHELEGICLRHGVEQERQGS